MIGLSTLNVGLVNCVCPQPPNPPKIVKRPEQKHKYLNTLYRFLGSNLIKLNKIKMAKGVNISIVTKYLCIPNKNIQAI